MLQSPTDLSPVFNTAARPGAFTVGTEESRVFVIDDVLANADELFEVICRHAPFAPPEETWYPGLNAPMPPSHSRAFMGALHGLVTRAFGLDANASLTCRSLYSLVTTPPDRLQPLQTLPHFDDLKHFRAAAVLYLCQPRHGGTGYFRQKATGFERVTPDRLDAYRQALARELEGHGPDSAYLVGSNAGYEMIGQVEARFNRMVLYPSNLLHSGLIDPATLSPDPRIGRLTGNLFIGVA